MQRTQHKQKANKATPSSHPTQKTAKRKIATKSARRQQRSIKKVVVAGPHSQQFAQNTTTATASLTAISPIDGRYSRVVAPLSPIFSEYALIRNRTAVEVRWLQYMHNSGQFKSVGFEPFSQEQNTFLDNILTSFTPDEAQKVKDIEKVTRHDVKAVEYYLVDKLKPHPTLSNKIQWLHFACTSEDITNLSYAMMLNQAREEVLLPQMDKIINQLSNLAVQYASTPMMSRTHGQTATPTTVGKEMGNFAIRLAKQRKNIANVEICGKFNGAVGNHNAHVATYPNLNWLQISEEFVTAPNLGGMKWSKYSSQIEFHDYISELFDNVARFNTILLDFNRDMWSYISLDYWKLVTIAGEVGSSTMPHKVNPIDFENSEGNVGLANATFHHLHACQ